VEGATGDEPAPPMPLAVGAEVGSRLARAARRKAAQAFLGARGRPRSVGVKGRSPEPPTGQPGPDRERSKAR
jgi:hypothetical protein